MLSYGRGGGERGGGQERVIKNDNNNSFNYRVDPGNSLQSVLYHRLIVDIDGIRVEFEKGWGLLRASNTSPMLVLRFEAQTEIDLENIKDIFYKNLKSIEPNISKF